MIPSAALSWLQLANQLSCMSSAGWASLGTSVGMYLQVKATWRMSLTDTSRTIVDEHGAPIFMCPVVRPPSFLSVSATTSSVGSCAMDPSTPRERKLEVSASVSLRAVDQEMSSWVEPSLALVKNRFWSLRKTRTRRNTYTSTSNRGYKSRGGSEAARPITIQKASS